MWFKKAFRQYQDSFQENPSVDTSKFNDKVADETSWDSLDGFSANFNTFELHTKNLYKLEYKVTLGFTLFIGPADLFSTEDTTPVASNIPMFVGAFFTGIALFMWFTSRSVASFDLTYSKFVKGRGAKEVAISFSDIQALQLLKHYKKTKNSGYHCYKLNVVLEDASREFVMTYGDAETARADAQTISKFIGCDVWDAID